jgi:hypothetical protein
LNYEETVLLISVLFLSDLNMHKQKRAASNLLIETVHTAKIVSSKYSYDLVETRSWIYVIKK